VSPSTYSVTEITQRIKEMLEGDPELQGLWVRGEISNWSRSRAGHCYFTLKDAGAAIRAVLWRTTALRLLFEPQDGQDVLAYGHISLYEPQGQYQLYVDLLQTVGRGELYLQIEALKERLAAEGLFDRERKRSLPAYPEVIGVVTSPSGAALHDICHVLERRWPMARVLLSPSQVQGSTAPEQIVAALQALYARGDIDLIVVSRGGGSLEDLGAFYDERVARKIFESPVPVVAGVGHEIDTTIAGLVADVRAPTPSAAAEVAVPDRAQVRARVDGLGAALEEGVRRRVQEAHRQLETRVQSLHRLSPQGRIGRGRQAADILAHRAYVAVRHYLALLRERTAGLSHRLEGLDPLAVLDRGYAIVHDREGRLVSKVAQVSSGDPIEVRVSDGEFSARVEADGEG
jgi:exodeoxyribonuclease VII large subunit